MESKGDELIRLFAAAMEADLTDAAKVKIINDLYEIMDIFSSVYEA